MTKENISYTKHKRDEATVCVVGLGYVGLPLAEAFAEHFKVIGFDIDAEKVQKLVARQQTAESPSRLTFTTKAEDIGRADFIIIAVPTPVTRYRDPDLFFVRSAAGIIGQNMQKNSTVILESTVYPGVTEEIVMPILEKESGFRCGQDFSIAYSPERINPGDEDHAISKITKVVAGMNKETTDLVAELYSRVAASTFKAKDIKTAEAAKVIENVQRDLNIALMNELSLIFEKMGLRTKDVLDAAATKWNFHKYFPGLVGGHCIPVDPYYLVYRAKEMGHHPQVILAGRAINDYMPKHVAEIVIKALNNAGKVIKGSKVLILGLTYKENVADTRESPVKGIIKELRDFGIEIYGCDPLLDNIEEEFGIQPSAALPSLWRGAQPSAATEQHSPVMANKRELEITSTGHFDAVILAVSHDAFKGITLDDIKAIMSDSPILVDIRGSFDSATAGKKGFFYWSL